MPYWDQWNLMPQLFIKISQNSLSWQDLIAQHNESRKLFPRLIFLGLAYLTNWDVRYEMLVIFMLACLVSVNIYRLNRLTVNANLLTTSVIALLANLLIFSPIQYDNWFWGIQLVVMMPIACITTAISVIYSYFNTRYKFLICMMLCIISTFSYSNGMIAWVIVLPVLTLVTAKSTSDLLKQKWLFLSWIAVSISNIIIYFYDYQKPKLSPSLIPAFRHPEQTLHFFLAFLGSPLGSGFEISPLTSSIFIGGVEIGIFSCLFIYLLKHIKNLHLFQRTIGWIMIAFYSIISALITAVGRVGFGLESALSSKYTTFSLYLIIAIIHLLPIVFSHISSQINPRKSQVWLHKITEKFRYKASPFMDKKAVVNGASLAISNRPREEKKFFDPILLFIRRGNSKFLILNSKFLKVAIAITGAMILHYQSFTYSVKEIKSSYQLRMEGKTCLSFINIIENKSCVEENILASYDYVKDLVNKLNYLGMLKPNLVTSNNIKAIANKKQKDKNYGSLDGIIPLNSWYFVNGWAFLPDRNEPADAIILTYKKEGRRKKEEGIRNKRMGTQTPTNEEGRRNKEEGGKKKEEGIRKKWMGTQTPTNYKHPVDDGVLNSKEKDDWIIFDVLMSAQTPRENLVQLFNNPAYLNAGWEQTISGKLLPKGKLKIAAWAFDAKSGKAYKLDTNHQIIKNGSI
ncbi:chloride channel protein [Okeania sp. KiyG1]|uniref:chloride channel protein n=1 Tax=Okeania sp. KiyG1 TaxID=2720165 RepID=UPI001F362F3B|nr:chloride channel protein [Okeania sp. KiyG1]